MKWLAIAITIIALIEVIYALSVMAIFYIKEKIENKKGKKKR